MSSHRVRSFLLAAFAASGVVIGLVAGVASPASAAGNLHGTLRADTSDFTFDSFTADYTLGRTADKVSTLRTVETLVAEFPQADQNHGIVRAIPLTDQNTNLDVSIVSVTDATGASIPFERSDQDGFAQVRIGSPDTFVHGKQTYVITYTQRNVVRYFADTGDDEFYWDVNGTGWEQPFGVVTAHLHLDSSLSQALTGSAACYVGALGSTDRCTISSAPAAGGGSVITAGHSNIGPQQNITMAVGFTAGTFATPPDPRAAFPFAVLPWILLGLAVAILISVAVARLFVWRTPKGRGIIIPEYAPPPGVFPALAAQFLRRGERAIPAQLIGFAVNRVAALIDHSDASVDKQFGLRLLVPSATVADPDERAILTRIFVNDEPGTEVLLDPDNHALGDRMAFLDAELARVVDARGLRGRAKSRLPRILGSGIVLVLVVWLLLIWWATSQNGTTDILSWGLWAVVIIAALVFWLARVPDLLTAYGVEVRDHLLGLREYLTLAEAERFRVLQSPTGAERVDVTDGSAVVKLNEKLLPYAIVWGVEKEWMRELAHSYAATNTEPEWTVGPMNANVLALQIVAFSSIYEGAPFAVTPPPSSGTGSSFGGSGGGGFSGGGGGGGG
ncbi:MAG TPA: DUF2207 domain-containing protein, partial [Diaminobutyricibacter sp.]